IALPRYSASSITLFQGSMPTLERRTATGGKLVDGEATRAAGEYNRACMRLVKPVPYRRSGRPKRGGGVLRVWKRRPSEADIGHNR
ncbi:hypothetical protein, partial [Runella sp.]|uniref:hypothetical protein n=1 Tax=Runella sp. TaxID=1960881 RepID=UPI003019F395